MHTSKLKWFKSKEYLEVHPPPDPCETFQKKKHHELYVRLLELHANGAQCFEVTIPVAIPIFKYFFLHSHACVQAFEGSLTL